MWKSIYILSRVQGIILAMKPKKIASFVKIPEIKDDCSLIFAQTPNHIPFEIKRIYYISKATPKLPRGFHAHKKNQQVLFCIQGSIKLLIDNGKQKEEIRLNKPNIGIFIDRMIWHQMHNFRKNTILLVLASGIFDEKDYIRDYESFKKRLNKFS